MNFKDQIVVASMHVIGETVKFTSLENLYEHGIYYLFQ